MRSGRLVGKFSFAAALVTSLSCSPSGPLYSGWEMDYTDFLSRCTRPVAELFEIQPAPGSEAWVASVYYCGDVWKYHMHPDIGQFLDNSPDTYTGPGLLFQESGAGLALIAGVTLSD